MNQRANGEGSIYRRATGAGQPRAMYCDPTEAACAALCTARPAKMSLTSLRS